MLVSENVVSTIVSVSAENASAVIPFPTTKERLVRARTHDHARQLEADIAPSFEVEITRISKRNGQVTKHIHSRPDGGFANDSNQCRIGVGNAVRLPITSLGQLAAALRDVPSNTAIALGRLRPGLPDSVGIAAEDRLSEFPGSVARSQDNLVYAKRRPGFCLLDVDVKKVPADIKAKLAANGNADSVEPFINVISSVCPELADAGYVSRASTSAHITRKATGERYADPGYHIFVLVTDASDAERFLKVLHDRLWLSGYGWIEISRAGAFLERSPVDRAVATPERLVFEASPTLSPDLAQGPREPDVHEGVMLDTAKACPDLSASEKTKLAELLKSAKEQMEPERAAVQQKVIAERTEAAIAKSVDPEVARNEAQSWINKDLGPNVELCFPKFGVVTVREVLGDPDKYVGAVCADPIEGPSYGTHTAKLLRGGDATASCLFVLMRMVKLIISCNMM